MKNNLIGGPIFCILFFFTPIMGQSCTTFFLDSSDYSVFGRNLDWINDEGLVVVNKRRVTKKAYLNALTWTSKYGSVTFSDSGRDFPLGGMNETGLVVESMALDQTKLPFADAREQITSLQWIQYQLDNSSSLEEVLSSDSKIRIQHIPIGNQLHYFVCDRSKTCAVIEFIDNKMVYYKGIHLPVKALTNSTYAESINRWGRNQIPKPDKSRSVERFIRAANMIHAFDQISDTSPIAYAFNILNSVSQPQYTQWSIVYDITNLSIHFRTFSNLKISHFSLRAFDFSCKTPVKIININHNLSGDIAKKFVDYTYQVNRQVLESAFHNVLRQWMSDDSVDQLLESLAKYPETTTCKDK